MTQANATIAEHLWTYDAVRVGQAGGETQSNAIGGGHRRIRRLRPEPRPAILDAGSGPGRGADNRHAHHGVDLRPVAPG